MVLVHSGAQYMSRLNLPPGKGARSDPAKNLPAFYIDRLEITVRQYKRFDSKYDEKHFAAGRECPDCPAMAIDWLSAQRYCLWAGKRLPTEAEWMASGGGGGDNPWPWGRKISPERANLWGEKDGSLSVAPVGSYPKGTSPYGLMDTIGNVWEWVSDAYVAPGKEATKVRLGIVKGGGWTSDPRQAGISFRNIVDPKIKNPTFGFRCAKSIKGDGWNHR